MRLRLWLSSVWVLVVTCAAALSTAQQSPARIDGLKRDVLAQVEARRDLTQQIVDSLFSFSELGFQEFETQRYLTDLLEKNGFVVRRGVARIGREAAGCG